MARYPHAIKMLFCQVRDRKPHAHIAPQGEPDGLGAYRTFRFDKRTSKWLAPLLEEIADPRLREVKVTDAGYLHVTLVADRRADDKTPFPLDDAELVTGSDDA